MFRIAFLAGQRRVGRPCEFRGALFGPLVAGQLHRGRLLPRQNAGRVVEKRLSGVLRQGPQRCVLDRRGGRGERRAARPGLGVRGVVPPRARHARGGAAPPHDRAYAQRCAGVCGDRPLPAARTPRGGSSALCRDASRLRRRGALHSVYRRRRAQCGRQLRREVLDSCGDRARCRVHAHAPKRLRCGLGPGVPPRRRPFRDRDLRGARGADGRGARRTRRHGGAP